MSPIRNHHSQTQSYLIRRANQASGLKWPKQITHRESTLSEYMGTQNQDATAGRVEEPLFHLSTTQAALDPVQDLVNIQKKPLSLVSPTPSRY